MKPVRAITGTMLHIDRADVDTDQIIPQQFLKRIERDGYGEFLFHNWAHHDNGELDQEFIINHPHRSDARVLVAGPNFGCGSSREHAAWAIQDWGFEAVIAPSLADIFKNNAANIGLLPIELDGEHVAVLFDVATDPAAVIDIDLLEQTIVSGELTLEFDIDPNVKERLLGGIDTIGVTLGHGAAISEHESSRPSWMPLTTAGGAA
jgi:3-isopropylmalate/(R)-2-methylmalate dehydratase small subunit